MWQPQGISDHSFAPPTSHSVYLPMSLNTTITQLLLSMDRHRSRPMMQMDRPAGTLVFQRHSHCVPFLSFVVLVPFPSEALDHK